MLTSGLKSRVPDDGGGLARTELRKVGVRRVDDDVPFVRSSDERRDDQGDRPLLVQPTVAEGAARGQIALVPAGHLARFLDRYTLRNLDANPSLRARHLANAAVREDLEQRARVAQRSVDRRLSRRIPSPAAALRSRAIEQWVSAVGDPVRNDRLLRPGGHTSASTALP